MQMFLTTTSRIILATLVALGSLSVAWAQDSGFLEDYSRLEPIDDVYAELIYAPEGAWERLAGYNGVMVDQPEIWIDPESPYGGAKPEAMTVLAETMRKAFSDRLTAGGYNVVEEPGPGVVFVHWAVTDLYLEKKKKKFYQYTPTAYVLTEVGNALIRDVWKKVDIVEMSIEAELIDSQSDDVIIAIVIREGARKDKKAGQKRRDPVTWEELDAIMQTYGGQLRCRLDNAKLPKDEWVDCFSIVIEAEKKR